MNSHRGAPGILTARTGRTGNSLVVADQAGVTAVWDLTTRRALGTISVPPAQGANNDDTWVSPDGTLAATMRTDAGPVVIDVATRDVVRQLPPLPFPSTKAVSASVQ